MPPLPVVPPDRDDRGRCEKCLYYKPVTEKIGECHRYPATETTKPPDGWCGEFKKSTA